MLDQPRVDPYDHPMSSPPPGTIPHDGDFEGPPPVTRDLLARGRNRFEAFCATCHGILGDGVSVVATKMALRRPPSLHTPDNAKRDPAGFVLVIERGYGLMPSYADALSRHDRWAVAHYVKALQLARGARVTALPPAMRDELAKEAP
jgi:mono/diheme cytochrome c family protein